MARLRELAALRPGKLDCFYVDPREIVIDPDYNCRDMNSAETKAHVEWLADCIEREGFSPEQPVTLKRRGDELVMVRGHCRHAACMLAISRGVELEAIPFMQLAAGMSDEDLLFDQETSNSGLRLDHFAHGRMIRKAKRMGIQDDEICRRMGWKSVKTVADRLALLELPADLRTMVSDGDVSATTAVKEVKKNGAEKATQTLTKARDEAKAAGKSRVMPKQMREPKAEPEEKLPPINVVRTAPIERPGPEDIDQPKLITIPGQLSDVDAERLKEAFANQRGVIIPSDCDGDQFQRQQAMAGIIETLRPFARFAFENDLAAFDDDHTFGVEVKALKRAAVTFAKLTGGVEP